jgi:flavin reductase (DIM6/NTAB) family NADH-FMN oxidoreductase RutF
MLGRASEARERDAMTRYRKKDLPLGEVRRLLEPGPVVLVSSARDGKSNIMTLGWHTMMDFTPALVGCVIAGGNHSYEMIRRSGECVINVPTVELARKVVGIGNCSGAQVDKFKAFKLTAGAAARVKAPLIVECYANLECRLADEALRGKYDFFVFEVVKAHVAAAPKNPKTVHYRGDGMFMVAGRSLNLRRYFRPDML